MKDESPCGIRHVDLGAPLADLTLNEGEQTVLAVFWWDGFVLGRRLFTKGELPVPSTALSAIGADAIADALASRVDAGFPVEPGALARHIEKTAAREAAPISVIVCTRHRPDDLKRCLASLARCNPAPIEIIVVDNAPETDRVRAIVEAVPGAFYVPEPRPGLSCARNTGMAAARGAIFAFTDDDVEVYPNWLLPISAAFADQAVGCVTGQVMPASLKSAAAFSFEFDYGGLATGLLPKTFDAAFFRQPWGEPPPVWKVGAGASMALRRNVVADVGPFDERLGAGASGCSEDSELFHRAIGAGWTCRYEPLSIVFHHHRDSLGALRRQMRAYMRGHVAALFVQFGQTRHPGNLMRIFVGLPWHFLFLGARLLLSPIGLRRQVFPWEILGFLEGPLTWLRRCRAPKFQNSQEFMSCSPVLDQAQKL